MSLTDDPEIVSSPCRRLCALDATRGVCVGCGRTLAEIAAWATLSEPERQTIMAGLAARLAWSSPTDGAIEPEPQERAA